MPIFDIHIHTSRHSPCSLIEASELAGAAIRVGLDGIIITEHGWTWSKAKLADLMDGNMGGLKIFSGQEVRTYRQGGIIGDALVFGVSRPFPGAITPEELIESVHREGGVVLAAHPYRSWLGLGEEIFELPLDGVEVLSGNARCEENDKAAAAAAKLGLPALGGSDAHDIGQVGLYATEFTGEVRSLEDIIVLIRKGRCRPVEGWR